VFSGRSRAVVASILCVSMLVGVFAAFDDKTSAQAEPDVLVVGIQQDMPDFNTWNLASNSLWKSYVINWGFEGLVALDYDMLPIPAIAESWTFDEPSLTWTFNIRHGVNFHDGTPLTADDVVFIFQHAREGTTYSANIINAFDANNDGRCSAAEMTTAITKVDAYTVTMKMGSPYGQFLTTTAGLPILPKAIWQNHLTWDGLLDVLWNDPQGSVGTGPFRYLYGVSDAYRIMEVFTGYWGRNLTTPLGYRLYPAHIDQLYFKVTHTMDETILALQSGTVDYIPWSVTAGRVPSLQSDPNIGMRYLSDNGYFYLAFNQKFDPMGDLSFRKAISHVIDKDQIVNVYMGGFGTKGDAAEPPFWGQDAWYNASVQKYPFVPDYSTPNVLLDTAGFVDQNSDGWRDLPDGTPMQKITILTPPADYDPIRIRAGQMIAKNMREGLHINAEAKALDFNTLVARLQSMDYQMLIIGWYLSADPVGNVFDILGPRASSNTFGFWSEANPNPYYKDLFGVVTRADAETQSLADEVLRLDGLAKSSFNVSDQIKYTRWAEGVIADAVPVNVLYYRVTIEAFRCAWVGWYPYMGTLFNRFSIGYLENTGAPAGLQEANSLLNAALSMPEKVAIGGTADAYVMAIDNAGRPVPGASVSIAASGYGSGLATVVVDPTSGSTDARGIYGFSMTGLSRGYSNITVTVSKGSDTSVAAGMVQSVGEVPLTLVLGVSPENTVLQPGESTVVLLNVSDENGDLVEGATITVDHNLISYGMVDFEQVVTDASGKASMIYTAPATINQLNAHLTVTLAYAVSKPGYVWTDSSAVNLLIYNSLAPQWVMAQIDSVGTTALSRASNSTTVTVLAVDDEGTPLANHDMTVTYSDRNLVFHPVDYIVTDSGGAGSIPVQLKDSTASFALRVTVQNTTVLNSVPATITLTHAGTGTVPTMYGGYMTWDTHYLDPVVDWIEATAHVWDETGAAADGVNASLVVSGTAYGSLVWNDYIMWDSTFDGWGINIVTSEDNANLVTSGPFTTYFDYANWETWYLNEYVYWNYGDDVMVPVDIVGGEVVIGIYSTDWAPIDLIGEIFLVPEGMGIFNDTTWSYQISGPTTISADYVIGRSYSVVTPKYYIEKPVMEARLAGYDQTNVSIWTYDETNAALGGAHARVYQNALTGNRDYTVSPSGGIVTDPAGEGASTIVAVGKGNFVTSASVHADVYVRAQYPYSVSMFSQSRVFIHIQQCFISMDSIQEVRAIGEVITVNVTVVDYAGTPIEGMPVGLSAGAGDIAVPTMLTGADGRAAFDLDTMNVTSAPVGFIPVRATAGGPAYDMCSASMMLAIREVQPPVADAGGDATVTEGDTVYFDGLGSTDNFVVANYTWNLTYDGSTELLYGDSPSFVFLLPGTYVVTLNVTDRAGNYDTDIVVITVETLIPEFRALLLPVIGLLAVISVLRRTRRRDQ